MSSQMKGLIGVVLAILAIFSYVVVDMLGLTPYLLFTRMIPAVVAIVAIILGVKARKDGARLWGIASITLGAIAAINHILGILQFASR